MPKVSDVMIEQLKLWGIKNVYGYPGDTTLEFFSRLSGSGLNLYTARHEGAAGLMASAEAKLTGNLSVCIVHSGPGTANVINGIADAYSDRVPLLLISGQVETWNIGTDYKQFVNHQGLTNSITVFSSLLTNPASIVDLMVRAMTMSITKGGVSHLVIPRDLWNKDTNAQPRKIPEHFKIKMDPDSTLIEQAADLISKARQPLILFGKGARNCEKELQELATKINSPLLNTLPAKGILSDEFPLFLGGLGHGGDEEATKLIQEADLIIILGATWWPMDYVPRNPNIIQIDATKENIAAGHPVNLGIPGDIKLSLQSLINKIKINDNPAWTQRVEQARKAWLESLSADLNQQSFPFTPQTVINLLNNFISPEEIICLDSGDNVIWFSRFFQSKCKNILLSGTWRTMGFGLPAALAAKINSPASPVTCITGDGGLTMVLGELLTAVRYNLPVRILVLNNQTLAMEKNRMVVSGLNTVEVDQTNPDFVKLAQACNIKGYRPENLPELENLLQNTSSLKEPVLIDLHIQNIIAKGTKMPEAKSPVAALT